MVVLADSRYEAVFSDEIENGSVVVAGMGVEREIGTYVSGK